MAPYAFVNGSFTVRPAPDYGQVFLVHFPLGKGFCQGQPAGFIAGDYEQAAGFLVKAVHNAGAQAAHGGYVRVVEEYALYERSRRAGRAGVDNNAGRL